MPSKSTIGCAIEECQQFLHSIQNIPRIKALFDGVSGGKPKIECRPCSDEGAEGSARAALFNDIPPTLVLCTNRLNVRDLQEAVTHELIHAYDYSNARCNFYECDGLAYTEVRAARESECSKYYPFEFLRNYCIQEHATRSTANLFGNGARDCVKRVFDAANADLHPLPKATEKDEIHIPDSDTALIGPQLESRTPPK